MYEIWLGLNILWELFLAYPAPPLAYGVLVLLLYGVAGWHRPAPWRHGLRGALTVAALCAVVSLWLWPAVTDSSLANMAYWLDWAFLGALALGTSLAALILAWPVCTWWHHRSTSKPVN